MLFFSFALMLFSKIGPAAIQDIGAMNGGGIANQGTLTVASSNLINNQAEGSAGGAGIGGRELLIDA